MKPYISIREVIVLLKKYKEEFGDCNIKKRYVTPDGVNLGSLVYEIRRGRRYVTDEEREELTAIGFVWQTNQSLKIRISFDEVINLTKKYIAETGNKYIATKYVTADGIPLGRTLYNIKTGRRKSTASERKRLKNTGIKIRSVNRQATKYTFDDVVKMLEEYKAEYGNLNMKVNYINKDGAYLGKLVYNIRYGIRKLSPEQKEILTNMGFCWRSNKNYISMSKVNSLLKEYKSQYGDCNVPYKYVTPDGIPLGVLVNGIRSGNRRVSESDIKMLNSMGFIWKIHNRSKAVHFDDLIKCLLEYKKEYGDLLVPASHITENGINLGGIVHNIRTGSRKITEEEREKLDEIGFIWYVRKMTE